MRSDSVEIPCACRVATARAGSQMPMSSLIFGVGMRACRRTSIASATAFVSRKRPQSVVRKNHDKFRPADLPRDLRQPSANAAEHAARRLPCP